jgi:U5 small nuclear ribonucleoprotein component
MDDSLYDEFGNYLGPDLEDEDEDLEMQEEEQEAEPAYEEEEPEKESRVEESALMQIDGKKKSL